MSQYQQGSPSQLSTRILSISSQVNYSKVQEILQAHPFDFIDMKWNPNIDYQLATTGEDNKIKFWDIRNSTIPIKTIDAHNHWQLIIKLLFTRPLSIDYNVLHDQLLLSSSLDYTAQLHNIFTISSAKDDHSAPPVDYDYLPLAQHNMQDQAHTVLWCNHNPWLYLAASFDGVVSMFSVSNEIKYDILL